MLVVGVLENRLLLALLLYVVDPPVLVPIVSMQLLSISMNNQRISNGRVLDIHEPLSTPELKQTQRGRRDRYPEHF